MMEQGLCVIIGAGKTGRGFIARLLAEAYFRIVFVDTSEGLIERLKADGAYSIHFFGGGRQPYRIKGVSAHLQNTTEAKEAMAAAEIIFTAVGEQHLPVLADSLIQASLLRQDARHHRSGHDHEPLLVITCENGIAPGEVLRAALDNASEPRQASTGSPAIIVSEAAIFCSTVDLTGSRLDIMSEDYNELPYDPQGLRDLKTIPSLRPIDDFKKLLQRKIYTYNCISACIAYLGAFKGYALYADAANDPDIQNILRLLLDPLDRAISVKLDVDPTEQKEFSERAIAKFSDRNISDDIARNARDAARKLAPGERLIAPAMMIMETGADMTVLALVAAAALFYDGPAETALRNEIRQSGAINAFMRICGLSADHALTRRVDEFVKLLALADPKKDALFTNLVQN